jgi:two-component system probable response regulator PhcQ
MSATEPNHDYRRFAILYVDDEVAALRQLPQALEDEFRFYTDDNAEEGLKILHEHLDDIGLVLSDQQMPGMKGAQFLERVRQLRPRITRMLVTAHSDLQAAIDSVNRGAIYRYLDKPWEMEPLSRELRRGLEYFMVQRERDALLREKLSALHRMVITDRVLSLGVLAAGLGHHVRNAMSAVRTFLDRFPAIWPDNTTLEIYASQFARLRATNSLPGPHDLWIAATALQFDIPLVTRNTAQFARIEGIRLESY